ncbi:uncharacterized protein RCC_03919 [Ramularia collo-cygni]|uniref:Uncharacterized protein n=1 Tax=Ramularia collo-cygni TaxID=112498 RepID=A0A2D3UY18_9PEZI|nr:uncharacterized protein RCC_03919 [Ramularia collo-cygni]CZT18080.1 uncharacterized protein RCC_03919 [Ramularia collo-cygni]
MTEGSKHVDNSPQEPRELREYWHIDQSQGGHYTIPGTVDGERNITALGSTGCRTCVCVFVELSNRTCFAAHISAIDHAADVRAVEDPTHEQRVKDNRARAVPDASKAQELMEMILKNLREIPSLSHKVRDGKFVGNVGRAIVVCPMKIWGGERAHGSYIIQALEQFFGVSMGNRRGHGFIAIPGADGWSLQVLGWKNGYPGPSEDDTDFYDWRHHEETPEEYGWTRSHSCEDPPLGGQWAFAFARAGMWVHYYDRD